MERTEFLADLISIAMEHAGYGFPGIIEFQTDDDAPAGNFAVIYDRYEETPDGKRYWAPKQSWRVDIDTMARGLGVLRRKYTPATSPGLAELYEADRENDASITDVIGALAVLEAAVFGDITYC
jgi:hypothetical protein